MGAGFEPAIPRRVYRFSRPARSTAPPPHPAFLRPLSRIVLNDTARNRACPNRLVPDCQYNCSGNRHQRGRAMFRGPATDLRQGRAGFDLTRTVDRRLGHAKPVLVSDHPPVVQGGQLAQCFAQAPIRRKAANGDSCSSRLDTGPRRICHARAVATEHRVVGETRAGGGKR